MLRNIHVSIVVFFAFSTIAFGLNAQKSQIQINKVERPPTLKDKQPWLFVTNGTVNVNAKNKNKDWVVVVYTKSSAGGRLQLQQIGEGKTREPNIKILKFGSENKTNWKMIIWLGNQEIVELAYQVYAVVLKKFAQEDGVNLINTTDDKYKTIEEVISVLNKQKFNALVYTKKDIDTY